MQLPTVAAYQLIANEHFDWIDQIFRDELPQEAADSDEQTILELTEWLNEPISYANQTFKGWLVGVEIQIFYKNELPVDFDMMEAEIKLADLFKKNGWNIEQSKNHIRDPDTAPVSKVFYFSKNLIVKDGQ